MGGHMGRDKTEVRLMRWLFRPGIYKMIEKYYQECPACQKMGGEKPSMAPLMPLLLAGWLFDWMALDIGGPFPCSRVGYQFVLIIVDCVTWLPKMVPLHSLTVPKIAEALMK